MSKRVSNKRQAEDRRSARAGRTWAKHRYKVGKRRSRLRQELTQRNAVKAQQWRERKAHYETLRPPPPSQGGLVSRALNFFRRKT